MAWDSEDPEHLWVGRRDGPNERITRDPALLSDLTSALSHYPGGHAEGFPDTFKHLALCVYGWIGASARGEAPGPPSFPTFEDGHREVLLCEAIARSAQTGVDHRGRRLRVCPERNWLGNG